jgi:NADH dehydrogenase/NADH:ubiquinone oxidoreductase subunit G
MKAFRFPLEKVLGWRHLQMRSEEEKLAALQQHLELLTRRANALASAEINSKLAVLKAPLVQGSELHALTAFQARVKKERMALAAEKAQFEKRIVAQRARLLKTRKDFRVLERLRERRMEAWTYSYNQEVENAAAEAHISKLIRGES